MKYKIGIIGLGVMGQNLALNMERNGFPVAGFDLDRKKTEAFLTGEAAGKQIITLDSIPAMIEVLEKPRRILMMVPAGKPVDVAIQQIKPHLEQGDILIDGGNSFFMDTERRAIELEAEGLNFVGAGVSGGEEGAKWGPAIMPGGQYKAWEALAPIFYAIAAKADDGQPCVEYMGPRGAGHYVKMVHNGIEYGDMQLIGEVYDILHRGLDLTNQELHEIFYHWNQGVLKSYLIEITADIFNKIDPETGTHVVDLILDEAQQKGTGKWTSQNALDLGAPIPTIHAALVGRTISALKSDRVIASQVIRGPKPRFTGEKERFIGAAENALFASKIISYAQGMGLLQLASKEYDYNLNLSEIAKIWRAGCIIRASLLTEIMAAYQKEPALQNLMLDVYFRQAIETRQDDLRYVIKTAIDMGISTPALSGSLAYFDAYRSERLPANLTQAQRDYFGAHTYRRIDREGTFHTQWLEEE
ncbi:MAG: phosphogluconate dehydrogenase (NADP(+)-dependent, decarboxylating) [Chloroflexi bacterium HGW-Chloroflexi-3]|nr:MAG: phosphogluconate dehydrogenase (NADP(+)-dependent, decarboxylating) [Chloroflexi bacterium HGW-Chloroflexi-3]